MLAQVRRGALLTEGSRALAMISGGRDSTCLLDVAVSLLGARSVAALHVNYQLRASAPGDEQRCRELCGELGVELTVHTAQPPAADAPGNLQAWAREVRYERARALARERDALILTGHTADDQVETILYRLAASPGRRALLGMSEREGDLVRPLLSISREQITAHCVQRGLSWREDESNRDARFARSRVRHELLSALRAVHPAAEANVLRTATLLRAEAQVLDELLAAELQGGDSIALSRLRELPGALARLVVVALAERAAGTYVPQAGERVGEILALADRGGRAELHLGGNAAAVLQGGRLHMIRLAPRAGPGAAAGDRRGQAERAGPGAAAGEPRGQAD